MLLKTTSVLNAFGQDTNRNFEKTSSPTEPNAVSTSNRNDQNGQDDRMQTDEEPMPGLEEVEEWSETPPHWHLGSETSPSSNVSAARSSAIAPVDAAELLIPTPDSKETSPSAQLTPTVLRPSNAKIVYTTERLFSAPPNLIVIVDEADDTMLPGNSASFASTLFPEVPASPNTIMSQAESIRLVETFRRK